MYRGYGRIINRKGDYVWELSSDYILTYRDDQIQIVGCYGTEHERLEDRIYADSDMSESEVLDLAESRGLIYRHNEYDGEYRVTDTRRLGCCGCSVFCDSAEEAARRQKDYLTGSASLSDILSVHVYKYVRVCDRGYYVHDDSFDYM